MSPKSKAIPKTHVTRNSRRTMRTQNRAKLSITVAAENYAFLQMMVDTGRIDSISEVVDLAVARLRRAENRARLERATADYFAGLSPDAEAEEQTLTKQLHAGVEGIDFDMEP